MFNWAKIQKLSNNQSPYKSSLSKTTKLQSQDSLPSSHKRIPQSTPRNRKKSIQIKLRKFLHQPTSTSKEQLKKVLNLKFQHKIALKRSRPKQQLKTNHTVYFPNQYLKQFYTLYIENYQNRERIYRMARILQEMGFINDLVHDRQLIHQLDHELDSPDILSLYVYIQTGMGGTVDMKEAFDVLGKQEGWNLSIRKANKIMSEKKGFHLFDKLRTNRIGRKK